MKNRDLITYEGRHKGVGIIVEKVPCGEKYNLRFNIYLNRYNCKKFEALSNKALSVEQEVITPACMMYASRSINEIKGMEICVSFCPVASQGYEYMAFIDILGSVTDWIDTLGPMIKNGRIRWS